MKAQFVLVQRIGDGLTEETAFRPSFDGLPGIVGWSGAPQGDFFACNVFAEMQSTLDAIAVDPRTEFAIPIRVTGKALGWKNKDDDIPANLHSKITSWIAKNGLDELGPNMKKPGQIAKRIMAQISGIEDVNPLEGFRVHWK